MTTFDANDLAKIQNAIRTLFEKINHKKEKELTQDLYDFELWIDVKEPEEIKNFFLRFNEEESIKIKDLPFGDYYFLGRNKDSNELFLIYVIERKSWSDFFSSVIDGRYRTQKIVLYQKARLLGLPTYNIIYLFEKNIAHPTEYT